MSIRRRYVADIIDRAAIALFDMAHHLRPIHRPAPGPPAFGVQQEQTIRNLKNAVTAAREFDQAQARTGTCPTCGRKDTP